MPTNAINDTGVKYVYDKLDAKKVDKEAGKGLSTNDYSNADKSKVGKIDETTSSKSGNPISISGLKANQLAINPIITFEPIQDLHGQSKPYPAGGGKNKAPLVLDKLKAINFGTWSGNVYTYGGGTFTVQTDSAGNITGILVNGTFTNNTVFYIANSSEEYFATVANKTVILNGCPSGGSVSTYSMGIWISGGGSVVDTGSGSSAITYPSSYANNNIAITCSGTISNKLFKPMVRLSTESDATFAPYENICPINGYDKVEALSCGKNIWDGTYDITIGVGQFLTESNVISPSGNWVVTNYIRVNGSKSYTISRTTAAGTSPAVCWYDANYNYINGSKYANATTKTISLPSNATFIRFSVYIGNEATRKAQLEEGSSATTYVPYVKPTSISESLGQTVYGGTLDVRTGVFTGTMAIKDMGDLSWGVSGSGTFHTGEIANSTKLVSSCYAYNDDSRITNNGNAELYLNNNEIAYRHGTNDRIYVKNTSYSDATAFKNAMVGQKIVYELATPFTIQLTPHEISLLKDYAYINTNGTSIALDYHNGELASLADVAQVGETVNELGDALVNDIIPGEITTKKWSFTNITITNNTDIPFEISMDGYDTLGLLSTQVAMIDRSKINGIVQQFLNSDGKIYLTFNTTQTISRAYIYLIVLYKRKH